MHRHQHQQLLVTIVFSLQVSLSKWSYQSKHNEFNSADVLMQVGRTDHDLLCSYQTYITLFSDVIFLIIWFTDE